MDSEMTLKMLKALADPSRYRIVVFLAGMNSASASIDDSGGVYVKPTASEVCCHITGAEKITSTISHHLHELEAAGIISIEREGKRMLCTLRPEALESLSIEIKNLTVGGNRNVCC